MTIAYWPGNGAMSSKLLRDVDNSTCVFLKQDYQSIAKMTVWLPPSHTKVTTHHIRLTGTGDMGCTPNELTAFAGKRSGTLTQKLHTEYQLCIRSELGNNGTLKVCSFQCNCPGWECDSIVLLYVVKSGVQLCQLDLN